MRNWKPIAIFISLGLGLAAAVLLASRFREPTLLERATRVVSMKEWEGAVWLSDAEVLLCHEGEGHKYRVMSLNLRTGVKTRAAALEGALSSFNNEGIVASSDGKWLLCLPHDGEPDMHVVSTKGSPVFKNIVDGDMGLCWIPGTHQWVHLKTTQKGDASDGSIGEAQFHDVGSPSGSTCRRIKPKALTYQYYVSSLAALSSDRLRVAEGTDSSNPPLTSAHVFDIEWIDGKARLTDVTTIHLPKADKLDRLMLSPQGDRVCWLGISEQLSYFDKLISRVFPRYHPSPRMELTVYIHNLPLGHTRRLAGQSSLAGDNDIRNLEWTPSGKRLSLEYQGSLWTIPVN